MIISGWWLNQPYKSNWITSPKYGWKQKMFETTLRICLTSRPKIHNSTLPSYHYIFNRLIRNGIYLVFKLCQHVLNKIRDFTDFRNQIIGGLPQLEVMSCEWRSAYMESTLSCLDSNRIWIPKMVQSMCFTQRSECKLHPNTSHSLLQKHSCFLLRLNTYLIMIFINMIQFIILISPQSRSPALQKQILGFLAFSPSDPNKILGSGG